MYTKLSFRKKNFTCNQTRPLLTIPKISSSHTQIRQRTCHRQPVPIGPCLPSGCRQIPTFCSIKQGTSTVLRFFCHRLSLCSWLLVTGGMASSQVVIALLSGALFCATSQFAIPRDTLDMVMGYGTGRIVVPRDGRR